MTNKVQIDDQELLVLLEFEDSENGKILYCLNEDNNIVYVLNNKILTENETIENIEKKYGLDELEDVPKTIY